MMQVTVVDHPLIKQKITKMRAEHTSSRDFRECLDEIAMLMTYEVARNLPLQEVEVATPVAKTTGYKVAGDIFVVPILRAGLGLLTGVLKMIPDARVGLLVYIVMKRHTNLMNIIVSFRQTVMRGKYLLWILCWQQEVQA